MARDDVIQALQTLRSAYPKYKAPDIDALIKLWERKFGDLDPGILLRAVDMHIDRSVFFPGVAEIKAILAEGVVLNDNTQAVGFKRLRQIAHDLEELYYHQGIFNEQEWRTLIHSLNGLGYESRAASIKRRMDAIAADVQGSSETEMGMVERV
jgi:hypothetical protein